MSTTVSPAPEDPTKEVSQEVSQDNEEKPQRRVYGNDASTSFLSALKGSSVLVKQPSGIEYHGTLQAVDGFLNVVLCNTKEVYEGTVVSELGEVFLRGSSVDYIAAN